MKRDVQINGQAGKLRTEGNRLRYTREGAPPVITDFEVQPLGPGTFWVRLGDRSFRVTTGGSGQVVVNGRRLELEVYDPRNLRASGKSSGSYGRQEVKAPMPGKVVRVLVSAGDIIEEGQGVVVVEAMKMQNEMKSPKAGTVAEVRTRDDATVAAGEVLVIIE